MTKRDDIIETMARAIAANPDDFYLNAKYYHLKVQAALTALEQSGYIVRPREATGRMAKAGLALLEKGPSSTDFTPQFIRCDTAMTEAWSKEQNDD